jgi:hypothetical protein
MGGGKITTAKRILFAMSVGRNRMDEGYLPAFDGSPILASCDNCTHCIDQSDGPEYGPSFYGCEKPGREFVSNLLSFPFSTPQKCCELDTVFLIDWAAEAKKLWPNN